jgi:hypothetical protein
MDDPLLPKLIEALRAVEMPLTRNTPDDDGYALCIADGLDSLVKWLDDHHPTSYYFDINGIVINGEPRAGYSRDHFRRCPTCEQWSPCDARMAVMHLLKAAQPAEAH